MVASAAGARDVIYSLYPDDAARYRQAIQASRRATDVVPTGAVAGGIVTHHFLASRLMVEFFTRAAACARPRRVILIGPDHERINPRGVGLSDLDWHTPFGDLRTDRDAVRGIRQALGLRGDDASCFFREHAIGVLAPFIRYYFPDALFLPVIVSSRAPPERRRLLAQSLAGLRSPDTMVILSMDFSHRKSTDVSAIQDRKAMDVIQRGDQGEVRGLDVDCRVGLAVMLSLFRGHAVSFGTRSDSVQISGVPSGECTSYVTAWFLREPIEPGR